ncbi:MAG: glycosyltransferase [Lachnospiraceae bacterium]|nr:glycosyltransferase [Lachnospiraceae bacterium]
MTNKIMGLATCFNRKEKTITALKSLCEKNPEVDFSFVICDDNSSDGTAQALSEFPNTCVVMGDGNSFYSGGMRLAMARALEILDGDSGSIGYPDYILLFNDDVDFYDGAIQGLIERSKNKHNENAIFVGPTCEDDLKSLSYGGIERKSNFAPKFRIVKADGPEGRKVNTFNANCVLVPTHLFVKTGIMDEVYNHSLGDFDYGYMLVRKGGEIFVSDEYVGVCPNNSEEGTWNDPKLKRSIRFKKKESIKGVPFGEFFHYLLKNYNFLTAVIFSLTPYARILIGK